MAWEIDHLVVAAGSLEAGVATVEAALGVKLAAGGAHPFMGTHNRLLSLGPRAYLEVIAIDPGAPAPGRPRWFGLDGFGGPPRLVAWVVRSSEIHADAEALGAGEVHALARGPYNWRIALPEDGQPRGGGAWPHLIDWQGGRHPAADLPDTGCRLGRLVLLAPDPAPLQAALAARCEDARVVVEAGPPGLAAEIETPGGVKVLA